MKILLLALLSFPAFAQVEAYLKPDFCSQDIKIPEGVNGEYYLSKDCKTVFVLPRPLSNITVNSFALGATVNDQMCGRVFNQPKRMVEVEKQIAFLEKKLNELYDRRDRRLEQNPEQEESINRTYSQMISAAELSIKNYNEILVGLEKGYPYSNFEGAQMNLHLSLNLGQDVTAYQEANKDSGLRFQPARIESGIVSFGITGEGKAESLRILDAQIPGINVNGGNRFEDSRDVMFRGGLSGGITLSQHSVCNLVRSLNRETFDENLLGKDSLTAAGFIANYSYEVPVQTLVSMKVYGTVTSDQIKAEFDGKITDGKFSHDELTNLVLGGTLTNLLTVEYSNGGTPRKLTGAEIKNDPMLNDEDGNNVFNTLYSDAMTVFTAQVASKLASYAYIRTAVGTDLEVVQGGTAFREKIEEECKRKPRFGRPGKKVCKKVVRQIPYYQAGSSVANRTATDNSALVTNYQIKYEQQLLMKHTTGFGEE